MNGFTKGYKWIYNQDVSQLVMKINNGEVFDKWELENLSIVADLDRTIWYTDNYKSLLYANYPIISQVVIDWRNIDLAGIPPSRICNLIQDNGNIILTQDIISSGVIDMRNYSNLKIEYNLDFYISRDWNNLKNRAVPYQNVNSRLKDIVFFTFKGLRINSNYYLNVLYTLPGKTTPNSSYNTYIPL